MVDGRKPDASDLANIQFAVMMAQPLLELNLEELRQFNQAPGNRLYNLENWLDIHH